jgi:hypothetical protein
MSAMWSAGGGFSNGSIFFFFGAVSSCFGVGFRASVGQNRSWNCRHVGLTGAGKYVVGMHTGMPVEVRMVQTSVGENDKLAVALAEINLASTKLGSASDSPRIIFMGQEMQCMCK